jgi:hypothetical protein
MNAQARWLILLLVTAGIALSGCSSSIPTPTPVPATPTDTNQEFEDKLWEMTKEMCPKLLAAYRKGETSGWAHERIVIQLANESGTSPEETNDMLLMCARYAQEVMKSRD